MKQTKIYCLPLILGVMVCGGGLSFIFCKQCCNSKDDPRVKGSSGCSVFSRLFTLLPRIRVGGGRGYYSGQCALGVEVETNIGFSEITVFALR